MMIIYLFLTNKRSALYTLNKVYKALLINKPNPSNKNIHELNTYFHQLGLLFFRVDPHSTVPV